jgi:hypothetical protein
MMLDNLRISSLFGLGFGCSSVKSPVILKFNLVGNCKFNNLITILTLPLNSNSLSINEAHCVEYLTEMEGNL